MKRFSTLFISAAVGAFAIPASAGAQALIFDFQGGARSFNFTLDQGETPDASTTFAGSNRVNFTNVPGTFTGVNSTADTASLITFGTGVFSKISISAPGFGFGSFGGPALFDGSRTSPMFNLGTFNLLQVNTGPGTGAGTLRISQAPVAAIPEPATWAMMIGGFGLVGAAMRRRVGVRSVHA